MIPDLPSWISLLFILTCIATIVLFHYSNAKSYLLTGLIIIWSIIHCLLAYQGFYQDTTSFPPRFALILVPIIATILFGLRKNQRAHFIEHRKLKISTMLHSVRIFVELILFFLFIHEMVPELMTFEGRNFDILIGLTAPIASWLYYKRNISNRTLLIWNWIGLAMVLFIFINGLLSAELPIQQFAFNQPNKAVIYCPFVLLPATIIPLVVFTHIIDILKLKQQISVMATVPSEG